ncbi:ribonuclease H-like domain-containing protein [Tanacetum coccineum]
MRMNIANNLIVDIKEFQKTTPDVKTSRRNAAEIYSVWDSQVVSEPVKNSELEEQTNPVITLHPSKLNMSGSHDEIPPPPPPLPSSSQTPTQQIPHTTSTIKLPILKKGEYDIWAMKMEHYLAHTDYPIWENCKIVARAREQEKSNERFAMALRKIILLNSHKMMMQKEMGDAIKYRFGGRNDESKSCRKMDLKWQVAMISMRMKKFYKKTGRKLQFDAKEPVGFDKTKVECYNCHKTGHFARECRIKGNQDNRRRDAWNSGTKDGSRTGKKEDSKALVTIDGEGVDWTNHSEEDEDYALMACNSSESDTEVTSCSNKCKESYANLKKLYDAQREQLSDASIEIKAYTQGLKKVEAQLVAHQQGQLWYEQKIKFMKIDLDDKTDVLTYHKKLLAEAQKEKEDLKAKVEKWHNSSKNLSKLLNTQMSANDKFGLGYGDHRYDGILSYENEVLQSVFMNKESELEKQPLYDSTEPSKLVSKPVVNESNVECQPKVWFDAPIIEEYESDSDDEYVSIPTKEQETPSFANEQVKTPRETVKNQFTHSQKPKADKKELGYGFTARACFVCESLNHLVRDCDFHEKRMARQAKLNKGLNMISDQREIRPIWNNVQRVNRQNQFAPKAILTRTGKIPVNTAKASGTKNVSTARHSFNRQAVLTSTAMKVNTVKPIVNRVRPANVFHKTHSPSSRPLKKITVLKTNFSKQKVNTAKDYPHRALKNKGIVDSGCSRHMTENKAYLAEFQDFNGGHVAFGGSKGYIIGKGQQEANHNAEGPKEEEQVFLDELERLKRQEKDANKEAEALRKEFVQATESLLIQAGATKASSTNIFSTISTPTKASSTNLVNTISTPVCTASPHKGLSLSDPTNPEQDDSEIPPLEDIYQSSTDGILLLHLMMMRV